MRERDQVASWLRTTRAQRRAGVDAVCASCSAERRPYALIHGRVPPCCFACDRIARRRDPFEDDHSFGQHNSDLTIRVPVNDHRAVLSVAQYQWPPETLQNPDGDPFLVSAARFRGLYNNFEYMLGDCLNEAERLEQLSARMRRKYGPRWWCEETSSPKPAKKRSRR
ncbi:MAG: hypothetical protein WB681_03120 [Candidatus Cybelea sp.]